MTSVSDGASAERLSSHKLIVFAGLTSLPGATPLS